MADDDRGASEADKVFDEAFDVAAAKPDLEKAGEPEAEKKEEQEKPEEKPPEGVVEKPPEGKPLEEKLPEEKPPEAQKPPEEEKYEQRYKTLQGILKHDKESWEEEKKTLLAQIEEAKKPAPEKKEPEKKPAEVSTDSLTEEEKKQLEEYEQDFDLVSRMEGLKRKRELAKLEGRLDQIMTDINKRIEEATSQIKPVADFAAKSETEAHFNIIRHGYVREDGTEIQGHPDFEKYRDDGSILSWIKSKPRYMQPAMKETYEKGPAEDVHALITDFKNENNITIEAPPGDKVVNIRKAEKKAALASVNTKRGAVNPGYKIADDFEGAFDEALQKGG